MFIGPAIISVREGIEAALILAIMFSYLRRTGKLDLARYVFLGTGTAVLSSLGVALVLVFVWGSLEGLSLNIFEGLALLVAAILLTTMIAWMWLSGPRMSFEIQRSLGVQVSRRNVIGLTLLAFTLVFREGVELVLFIMALLIQDPLQAVSGSAIGLTVAGAVGIGLYHGSLRIDIQAFFRWTSLFLVLFASGMIAYGVHELQEAGLLLIGPVEIWDINPPALPDGSYHPLHENGMIGLFLKALFGYNGNPSALEVVTYVSYLLTISLLYFRLQRRDSRDASSTTGPFVESVYGVSQPRQSTSVIDTVKWSVLKP
ncbi:MAG: FTR1 family protein [Candidatus Thorarchaeota archaeon]|nr:FTR1 family protein [Candidatus Thorarchaeota archaeon]